MTQDRVKDLEDLAEGRLTAMEARIIIWQALSDQKGVDRVCGALTRWSWRSLTERKTDQDMRAWHRLLLDTAGRIEVENGDVRAHTLRGFASLLRLSIEASDVLRDLSHTHYVRELLLCMKERKHGFLSLDEIQTGTVIGDANLPRTLTLLALQGMVERSPHSAKPEFRITEKGLLSLGS